MRILGVYKIHYLDLEISQTKNLIWHQDFLDDIKPSNIEIDFLESKKETFHLAKVIKKRLRDTYGEHFFTTQSPLYDAMNNSCLKLYNGQSINVEIIEYK